jgi:tetratricopeptide (TPR) repeat protein
VSQTDSKAIQDFVVMKYGLYYTGLADPIAKPDPIAKWKYEVGGNLGELAGYLTLWWRIWNDPKFEARVGSFLTFLDDDIKAAPKGVPSAFIANLRKLNSLGSKPKFTDPERKQLNDLLTQALLSAIALTNVSNANDRMPLLAASASNLYSSSGKSASEYFEAGKSLAAKGEYKNAVTEFDQAAKLDPANGLILFHRALVREKLGLIDEAIADYNVVVLMLVSLREAFFIRGTL